MLDSMGTVSCDTRRNSRTKKQIKYNSTGKPRTFENLAGNKGAELIETVAEFLV